MRNEIRLSNGENKECRSCDLFVLAVSVVFQDKWQEMVCLPGLRTNRVCFTNVGYNQEGIIALTYFLLSFEYAGAQVL